MQLTIAAVGRIRAGAERELLERYLSRLESTGRQLGISDVREIELPDSARGSAAERRGEEAEALLKKVTDDATLVALDESGKTLGSEAFARKIEKFRDGGARELVFAIGGADGHGPQIAARAAMQISLGPMTLPHALARVVLAEQLYRAATILSGHPYHRA